MLCWGDHTACQSPADAVAIPTARGAVDAAGPVTEVVGFEACEGAEADGSGSGDSLTSSEGD